MFRIKTICEGGLKVLTWFSPYRHEWITSTPGYNCTHYSYSKPLPPLTDIEDSLKDPRQEDGHR
jgi:hypothetical protein